MTPSKGFVNLAIGIIVAIVLALGGGYYVYEKTGGDVSFDLPPILSPKADKTPEDSPMAPIGESSGGNQQPVVEQPKLQTYRLSEGNFVGPNYPPFKNFEIKYPLSWTYKEFSKNIEGIAFYPKDMPDGGSVGGGMQINAAIVLSPYYHDMTGAITTNSSTHHNFVDESGKIMASANLLDPKYQEEFDEMITHFEFID